MTMVASTALLIVAGWALLCWAFLAWHLGPRAIPPQPDLYAAEVAEFRRQLHDWDRR